MPRPTIPNTIRGRRALYETQGRPRNHYARRAIQRAGKMANMALTSIVHVPSVDLERAHWIDISYWQEYLRPPDTTPYPIDGVFQRVAFGLNEDGARMHLRNDISQVGVPACSYQYNKTNANMLNQAHFHLSMREGMEYVGFMQDWEKYGNAWNRNHVRDAYEAYLFMQRETNQPGWVYMNPAFYWEFVEPNLSEAEIQTLNIHWAQWWLNPSPLKNPGIPRPWQPNCPWQYTAIMDGDAYGVGSASLDGDVWQETTEQVNALFGDDPPPPPDDTELAAQVETNRLDISALKIWAGFTSSDNTTQDEKIKALEDASHEHDIDPPPPDGDKLFVVKCNIQNRVYTKPNLDYEWNVEVDGKKPGVFVRDQTVVRVLDQADGWYQCEPQGMYKDGKFVPDNKGWVIGGQRRDLRDPGWLPRSVGLGDT